MAPSVDPTDTVRSSTSPRWAPMWRIFVAKFMAETITQSPLFWKSRRISNDYEAVHGGVKPNDLFAYVSDHEGDFYGGATGFEVITHLLVPK